MTDKPSSPKQLNPFWKCGKCGNTVQAPTPPEICLPTCSAGLTMLRTELLNLLTAPTPLAEPVKAGTMR